MVTKLFGNNMSEDNTSVATADSSITNTPQQNNNTADASVQDNVKDDDVNDDKQLDASLNTTNSQANMNNNVLALPDSLSMQSIIKTSGIIGIIRALGNTIIRRFRKCAKILLKMQNDFISQEGLDVSKVFPGSGFVGRLTNFFSDIFGSKSKDSNIGVYSFVQTYVHEVEDDFKVAVNSFNALALSSTNESVSEGINSLREYNTKFHLNEESIDEADNALASYDDVISKNGNLFIVKNGKETKLNVTTESTREICSAIIASFLNKYTNQEKIYKKLGIDTVNEIDDKNYNKFVEVLKLYKGAVASKDGQVTNANIFGRVKNAYSKMVDSYMRIGQTVINNFTTYAKRDKTKDGKVMSEKNSNLLSSSSEKLQMQWDKQKDFFIGAYDKVILLIIQSQPYQKYIQFIMDKVVPTLKSGAAKPDDATLPFIPKQGQNLFFMQSNEHGEIKYIYGQIKSYNNTTGEVEIDPKAEVKDPSTNLVTNINGMVDIKDPDKSIERIPDDKNGTIKLSKSDFIKSDPQITNYQMTDNNTDYYVYEFTGKDNTKYKIIAKGEATITSEPNEQNTTAESEKPKVFGPDEAIDEADNDSDKNDNIKELVVSALDNDKPAYKKINVNPNVKISSQDILNGIKAAGFTDVKDKSNDTDKNTISQEFNKIESSTAGSDADVIGEANPQVITDVIKRCTNENDSENSGIDLETLKNKANEIAAAIGYILRVNIQESNNNTYVYQLFGGVNRNDTKYNYNDPSKPNYIRYEGTERTAGKLIMFKTNILCVKDKNKPELNKCLDVNLALSDDHKLIMKVNAENITICNSEQELDKICGAVQKKQEHQQQPQNTNGNAVKDSENINYNNSISEDNNQQQTTQPQPQAQPQQQQGQTNQANQTNSTQGNNTQQAAQPQQNVAQGNLQQPQQHAKQQPFKLSTQLTQEGINLVSNGIFDVLKNETNEITVVPDDKLQSVVLENLGTYLKMSYENLINESASYLAKIKRTVANANDPLFKGNDYFLVSKSAYSDGTYLDTPHYIKETLEHTIAKNDNYDDLAIQAKSESSFNLTPLSESQTYYTSMPVNRADYRTSGNILYEAVSLVHFDNNSKIDFAQYLGTNKID